MTESEQIGERIRVKLTHINTRARVQSEHF